MDVQRFVDPDAVLAGVLQSGPPQILTARADGGEAVYVALDESGAIVEVATTDAR